MLTLKQLVGLILIGLLVVVVFPQVQAADYNRDGVLDLYGIARNNSASTEVHVLNGAGNYGNFLLNVPTPIGATGGDGSWAFDIGDYNRDGIPDLYAISKQQYGSTATEIHVLNGANNFQSFLLNTRTAMPLSGTDYGWVFAVGDYNRDGIHDVYGIARQNSAKTEVHVLNGATNFQSFLINTTTPLPMSWGDGSWAFDVGDYNRDGFHDVYGIAKHNTGSGKTEVHVLNGATNFQSFLINTPTALGMSGTDQTWVYTLGDYNRDGALDLYGIVRQGTGSGTTEVHILTGANNFQSFILHAATPIGMTGGDGSWTFETFSGPAIAPPPPPPPTATPPPPTATAVPDRVALARWIRDSPRIILARVHPSGVVDDAFAWNNIVDTANGDTAARSCYGNAPCGRTWLRVNLLSGMKTIASSWAYNVSEIAGASHSVGSRHYDGVAMDVDRINGTGVSSSHPSQWSFRSKCSSLGATEVLGPGDSGHSTHIHCAWPRP